MRVFVENEYEVLVLGLGKQKFDEFADARENERRKPQRFSGKGGKAFKVVRLGGLAALVVDRCVVRQIGESLLDELAFADATPAVNENIALLGRLERFLNTGELMLPANEFYLLGSFRLGFVRVNCSA